ncbi:MAG TPA: 2-phospho-L-lactate transferase CofD family protein, partial [Candidatus Levybacteria bacterium]|nr:2-phospho-L-lactate transferase CofD family protein [Candidatus Levybacteria bacterium]
VGEHEIDEPKHDGKLKIAEMYTTPRATISPKAAKAIRTADYIFLGPGDFYTNTIANLIVDGVCEAIMDSPAKLVFIGNLMTKYGETYNYTISDYLDVLNTYIPTSRISTVLLNNDLNFSKSVIEKYAQEHSIPVKDDIASYNLPKSVEVVRAALLLDEEIEPQKGDTLKRSIIRHDSDKLASVLKEIIV